MKSYYFSKHRLLSTSDVTMHNVPCGVSEKAESSWVYSLTFSRPSSHIRPLNGRAHCTTCDVINLFLISKW